MKYMSSTIYHPVGTCKMGINSTDPGAVVDEKLKVRGVSRLRVADASVMPTIISSNTQCAVYMIGEKVSDMIKTQYA